MSLIKSFIKNKLGLSQRVYARKLQIDYPTKEEQKEFFNSNHFHKHSLNKITIGLRDDQRYYAMLSLRHSYGIFEIARFASLQGFSVVGGFNKLMKRVIEISRQYEVSELVTHLYNDICPDYRDSIYNKYGFQFIHDSGPSMYYYDSTNKELHYRHKFQKNLLREKYPDVFDENLTEIEILKRKHIYPLYDAGTSKFILNIEPIV